MKTQGTKYSALLVLTIAAGYACAGESPKGRPSNSQAAQNSQGAAVFLSRAIQSAGLRTCKPLADQVIGYLTSNNRSSGMLFVAPETANSRIFSAAVEVENDVSLTYVSTNFSPYGELGCGASYDAVTYWRESCAAVASRLEKDLQSVGGPGTKVKGPLGTKINMLDGGPNMRMYLMPAGPGCVQIKKEMVY